MASRLEREELEDELVKCAWSCAAPVDPNVIFCTSDLPTLSVIYTDKLAYADLSHLAAASQASTSPLQMRRQSEMSISSSLSLDPREAEEDTSSRGGGSARGSIGGGFGLGGGRWFSGSSSAMSQNGSSQGY